MNGVRPSKVGPDGTQQQLVDVAGNPIGAQYRGSSTVIGNGEKVAVKYWYIEIPFSTPASVPNSIQVPLNQNITGVLLESYFWSIEAYSAATIPTAITGGATMIPQAAFTNSFMTLQDKNSVVIWKPKPLRDLQTINDTTSKAGKWYVDSLGGIKLNWQNSQIDIYGATNTLVSSTNYVIGLGLAFSYNPNWYEDGVGGNYANAIANS